MRRTGLNKIKKVEVIFFPDCEVGFTFYRSPGLCVGQTYYRSCSDNTERILERIVAYIFQNLWRVLACQDGWSASRTDDKMQLGGADWEATFDIGEEGELRVRYVDENGWPWYVYPVQCIAWFFGEEATVAEKVD